MVTGLLVAVVLALAAPRPADVVELRNGRILEGEVLEETEESVTLRMEGGQVTFEKRLVSAIRREAPGGTRPPAGGPGASPGGGAAAEGRPLAGVEAASRDWALLWSPERRVGWRVTQARREGDAATFEEETTFLAADGSVETTLRLLEEAGPGLAPVSFHFRESAKGREFTRSGKVVGGRLLVETFLEGMRTTADHPLPPGFRLPLAARALVLREFDRLPGGWKGTTFDPRTGEFTTVALRCRRRERVLWEGEAVEVLVLERERGGVLEEERLTAEGRVLTADLNGPALTAVGTTAERISAFREGTDTRVSEEERRARTLFVAPEDGFRIFKPGIGWEFSGPGAREGTTRVTVRDASGIVSVSVAAEAFPAGEEPPPAALGAALERRLRATSADLEKLEDGYGTLAGRPAYRLLCDASIKGDRVRTLAWALAHRGRVWTFTATAPRTFWSEAAPYVERILAGFEWL